MSRNLYKIWARNKVCAFITAMSKQGAQDIYFELGGKAEDVIVEQITFGYPERVEQLYF